MFLRIREFGRAVHDHQAHLRTAAPPRFCTSAPRRAVPASAHAALCGEPIFLCIVRALHFRTRGRVVAFAVYNHAMNDLPLIKTIAAAFTAAWVLGLITQRLRLSPIVGYLLAGVA